MAGLQSLLDFVKTSYRGIDFSLEGNGGFECYDYLSITNRVTDTLVFVALVFVFIVPRVARTINLPKEWEISSACKKRTAQRVCGFRKVLLIMLSVVLGIEIGYKIADQSWIFLLNPCHMITLLQIYLLSSEPSRTCTAVFRVHIHLLFGAFLAVIFPILNTRIRHGEQMIYYLQHFVITFLVPPYLMHTGGAYRVEPLRDFSWVLLTVPIFGFYMYFILQATSMFTLVNLNNMLCPAVSDPFSGPNYRWFAMGHQTALILVFGKLYTLVVTTILKIPTLLCQSSSSSSMSSRSKQTPSSSDNNSSNTSTWQNGGSAHDHYQHPSESLDAASEGLFVNNSNGEINATAGGVIIGGGNIKINNNATAISPSPTAVGAVASGDLDPTVLRARRAFPEPRN